MIRRIYNALALLLITAATAVAQDATTVTTDPSTIRNKKGEAYLPVADEWALGVSATPILGYLGNFVNGYQGFNSSPSFSYAANPASALNNVAVFGKMMVDANTAYRVRFNVGINNTINKSVVLQDLPAPDPAYPAFTEDWQKINSTAIVITAGYEKRRGSTRLQGVYGGEVVFGLSNQKVNYEYGNSINADFTDPQTFNFSPYGFGNNLPAGDGTVRVTEDKSGLSYLVGVRGFIGVEYFFAPKMSIGGEFGYMFGFRTTGRALRTTETFDAGTNGIRETKTDLYNSRGIQTLGVGLDNLSGSINLLFYF